MQNQSSMKNLINTIPLNEDILMQELDSGSWKPSTQWTISKNEDEGLFDHLSLEPRNWSLGSNQLSQLSVKEAELKMKEILGDKDKLSTAMKWLIGIQAWIDPIEIIKNIIFLSTEAVKENVKTGQLMPDDKTRLSASKTLLEYLDMMKWKWQSEVNVYLNDTKEYI